MADDVKDSVIQKTQKTLGKHITKPSLTPKLLKKPPFRFLHDIVTSVIKETAFLKGLYNEQEMISDNVKEREAKIAFLTKLTDALVAISGTEIDIKPGKIVAGLEPTKTNKLLQLLGSCLDKKLDSAEYVSKRNSGGKTENEKKNKKVSKTSKESPSIDSTRKTEKTSKSSKTDLKTKTSKDKTDKISKLSIDSVRKESKTKTSKVNEKEKPKKIVKAKETEIPEINPKDKLDKLEPKEIILNEKNDINAEVFEEPKEVSLENQITIIDDNKEPDQPKQVTPIPREMTATIRPKSAAKTQPEIIQNAKHEVKDLNQSQTNFLRPPSVRPMSSRPGAPRLRPESTLPTEQVIPLGNINVIVENYNNQDEEETVVIQSVELPEEQPTVEDVLNIPQDKGHLVEQILEQINDVDDFTQMKNKKDEDLILDTHSRDATRKEILQLQNLVQTLTKVANPLGKLMTYLHEDLDGMHSELMMWINMKKQAYAEIKKQKEQHNVSSTALKQQLEDVEENIKKVELEIAYVQSNIFKNDQRIKQLLTR